jgi:hypothetical protein
MPKENKTVTNVRLGGVATLTIEYQSYQVTAASKAVTSARRETPSGEGAAWADGGGSDEGASFLLKKK